MRKLVVLALLVLAPVRANACPDANLIPDWFAYAFAGGLAGGYAYGTYYFATSDAHDNAHYIDSLTFNGLMGTITGTGTVASFADGKPGTGLVLGGLTVMHASMAIGAASHMEVHMPHIDSGLVPWIGGSVFALDALAWASEGSEDHGRGYGIAEASIHAPMALGLGYLAYTEARDGKGGPAILFGGAAAISAALTYQGVKIAATEHHANKLDLLDVMPTIVDDGKEIGAGLGTAGTW